MRTVFSAMLTLLLVVFVGCSDELAPTAALNDADAATTVAAKGGASGPSASGHMNLTIGDGLQTMSFHAREKKDGTVEGSFENKSRGQDLGAHGVLNCLVVDGNVAKMSGYVTQVKSGDDPDFVTAEGQAVLFIVKDNGEGKNSPDDEWTDVFFLFAGGQPFISDDPERCTRLNPDAFVYLSNEAGNIQVKP